MYKLAVKIILFEDLYHHLMQYQYLFNKSMSHDTTKIGKVRTPMFTDKKKE